MSESKVYILQKDLPDYKAGTTFTHNGRYYDADTVCSEGTFGRWPPLYVEKNPEWFLPAPQPPVKRIEVVRHIEIHDNFKGNGADTFWYQFSSSIPITKERLREIGNVIEDNLNNVCPVTGKKCDDEVCPGSRGCNAKTPIGLTDIKEEKTKVYAENTEQKQYKILESIRNGAPHKYGEPCEKEGCKIYSIKRLSDNEVFTIGDSVMVTKKSEVPNWVGQIKEFWIDGFGKLHICYNGHHYKIKHFVKVKPNDNG